MQFVVAAELAHRVEAVKKHICCKGVYEGESISNQPNLFPVEIHRFFFDVIAL